MRRFWAGLAIAISLAAITAGGVVITQDDAPAAGTANAFTVASGAGSCTRSATPIDYATAVSNGWTCGSFDAANDICQGGDTVIVKGGTYGSQTLSGANSRNGSRCTISMADGETVNTGSFTFGEQGGANAVDSMTIQLGDGADWNASGLEFYDNNDNITIDGPEVDGWWGIWGASNITIQNWESYYSESPPGGTSDPTIGQIGNSANTPTNIVIDRLHAHDWQASAVGDHVECIQIWSFNSLTIRNSTFGPNCNVFGIFMDDFGGTQCCSFQSVVIENNLFYAPNSTNPYNGSGSESLQYAAVEKSTCEDGLIQNNVFLGNFQVECDGGSNNIIRNNIFSAINATPSGCAESGTSWSYNLIVSSAGTGSCDATHVIGVAHGLSGDNIHLANGSAAISEGDPSNFAATDYDGDTRPIGSGSDIGMDERGD